MKQAMIQHYLKTAWRNLSKYRTQTVVNVAGLAVGFACFAFASIWIRYELTYDAFQPDADRTYVAYRKNTTYQKEETSYLLYKYVQRLRTGYPEVEQAAFLSQMPSEVEASCGEQRLGTLRTLAADSSFVGMFGIRVLRGNDAFMHAMPNVGITAEAAMRKFGTTDVVGRRLLVEEDANRLELTISAVVSGWEGHSNFPFDLLTFDPMRQFMEQDPEVYSVPYLIVRLRPGTDYEAFSAKLFREEDGMCLVPLTRYHCSDVAYVEGDIRFGYLFLFALTGLLVVAASLANYLSLYMVRLRMRGREIALRKVNGASAGSVLGMFLMEFAVLLGMSFVCGMVLIELFLPAFRRLSGVEGGVYAESMLYFAGLAAVSVLCFVPVCLRRYRLTAASSLHAGSTGMRALRLRSGGIVVQLVVSLLLVFCVCVLLKQLHYLRTADFGLERRGIAVISSIRPRADYALLDQELKRLPMVDDVLSGYISLVRPSVSMSNKVRSGDGEGTGRAVEVSTYMEAGKMVSFYGLRLLEGSLPEAGDTYSVVINETAARELGLAHPVGKRIFSLGTEDVPLRVCGVVKDFRTKAPTLPVRPCMLFGIPMDEGMRQMGVAQVLVKYDERQWPGLVQGVDSLLRASGSGAEYELENMADVYDRFLKSERALLLLLGVLGSVCVAISVFGVFSYVTLDTERRRKEVAIRKVNGARAGNILRRFLYRYLALLVLASAVAFPAGYVLMRRWLENYVEQTPLPLWISICIFAGMALLIVGATWRHVACTARENPADVLKSE